MIIDGKFPPMVARPIELPEYEMIRDKARLGQMLTALEQFIFDQEPFGPEDRLWREGLRAALEEASSGRSA